MMGLFFIVAASLDVAAALILGRALPAQNVAMIFAGLAAFEAALEAVWNRGFAPIWAALLFWPATIVLARAGCRRILRKWKQDWNYGAWLVVMAGGLAAAVQFALARFDSPPADAAKLACIRFFATAFILVALSPWFISKSIRAAQGSCP